MFAECRVHSEPTTHCILLVLYCTESPLSWPGREEGRQGRLQNDEGPLNSAGLRLGCRAPGEG